MADLLIPVSYTHLDVYKRQLLLSSLELLLPNHEPLYLLNSTPCPVLADGTGDYPPPPDPVFFDSRYADSMFTSFTTASEPMKSILEYARRLSLYDFPVLFRARAEPGKNSWPEPYIRQPPGGSIPLSV